MVSEAVTLETAVTMSVVAWVTGVVIGVVAVETIGLSVTVGVGHVWDPVKVLIDETLGLHRVARRVVQVAGPVVAVAERVLGEGAGNSQDGGQQDQR